MPEETSESEEKNTGKFERYVAIIQPVAFCLLLANSMSDALTIDLMVFKTCVGRLNLPERVCAVLHDNSSSAQAQVIIADAHRIIGTVLSLKSAIEIVLPTILALFLGPWSDKFGRKPLIILPFIGFAVNYILLSLLSQWNLNPYWYLLPPVCLAISGGRSTLFVAFVCYVSDRSLADKDKAWNLALLDASIYTGTFIGMLSGPVLFYKFGYSVIFAISGVICLLACLFTVIFLKETIVCTAGNENRLLSLVNPKSLLDLLRDLIRAVVQERQDFNRFVVWCCILAIMLQAMTMEGSAATTFLFASARLGWNISDYSVYTAANLVVFILGTLITIRITSKILGLRDTSIVILACTSEMISTLIKAFTYLPWHFYMCIPAGSLGGAVIPVLRSIIARHVPQLDLGKAFSLITTLEAFVPVIANFIYLTVYTNFLPPAVYPSPVWFLTFMICSMIIAISLIIARNLKRYPSNGRV